MRRPASVIVPLALVLALGTLAAGPTVLGGTQEEATPAATEYFPPYDEPVFDPETESMVVILGETTIERSVEERPDNQLVLAHVRLNGRATNPIEVDQAAAEIISVDTGAVVFRFLELEGEGTLSRWSTTDGREVREELSADGRELLLLPGDRIVHQGRARYTYQFEPDVAVPAPGTGYAVPGAFPSLACAGGCRARLTIASYGGGR